MSNLNRKGVGITIFLIDLLFLFLTWNSVLYLWDFFSPSLTIFQQIFSSNAASDMANHLGAYIVFCSALCFIYYNKGHYTYRIPWWNQVRYLLVSCIIVLLLDGFLLFSYEPRASHLMIIFCWGFVFIGLLLSRQCSALILRKLKRWKIHCVVMGDVESVVDVLFALDSDSYNGYFVEKIFLRDKDITTYDVNYVPSRYKHVEVIDSNKDYLNYLKDNKNYYVILAMDSFRGEARDAVMELLEKDNIRYALVPPIKRASLHGMEPQYFFGYDVMFLSAPNKLRSPMGLLLKRLMDISVSLTALLCASPIMLFTAFMVTRDGGPVFFKQQRIGKDGEFFSCYKFRSMVIDANERLAQLLETDDEARQEFEETQKLKNDPRVTAFGNFIRKWSIDELPQLLNILKGDMSLVGPRPIQEKEKDLYGKHLRYYMNVKPGLTGLWQVSGRNDISYEQRVRLDNWYVKHWSLWNDIVIVFKTVKVVVKRSGAY